jgi:hypothetical protein
MDDLKEKLHNQFKELKKIRKDENDALKKIINALTRKEQTEPGKNKPNK